MATRQLTNVEVLPALEPLELERAEERALSRLRSGSWARGALLLDAVMLAAASAAAQLGAGDAGILRVAPVWLVAYAGFVLLFLYLRGLYSWRLKVSVLDDVRGPNGKLKPTIVLTTCHPKFSARQRMIIFGDLVSAKPASRSTPA